MLESVQHLRDLLSEAKEDVKTVTQDMDAYGIKLDSTSRGKTKSPSLLKPTRSRIEMRREKTMVLKAKIEKMHANSELSTLETEHLKNELWKNRYDEVSKFIDRRTMSAMAPVSNGKSIMKLNIADEGLAAEWTNSHEIFYSTGNSQVDINIQLKNVGSKAWPRKTTLKNKGGELVGVGWESKNLPDLEPGICTDVYIQCKTPSREGKVLHYFQVQFSDPEEEEVIAGKMLAIIVVCSALGKSKKVESDKEQKLQESQIERSRSLSIEGQNMWHRATSDSPIVRKKTSPHLKGIEVAFGGQNEDTSSRSYYLPGLIQLPGVPMHPAGKAREIAAQQVFRDGGKK